MHARNSFGVGFLRGLNSVAEVFAPYPGACEDPPIGRARSGWAGLRENVTNVLGVAFAKTSLGVSKQQLATSRRSFRPITRFVSAHWRGPLPPTTELEKVEQMIPGGADRLLRMAEQDLQVTLRMAEKDLEVTLQMAEKNLQETLQMAKQELQIAEKEQAYRMDDSRRAHEDSRRGQWLGWLLAAGALTAATVVSLFHAPWQVSVGLVGIPVLGAVQALIQGRKEKPRGEPAARAESSHR